MGEKKASTGSVAKPTEDKALEKKIKALLEKKYPGTQIGKIQVFDVKK